jgi:hypothetical protein
MGATQQLDIWIPSNRQFSDGKPKAMDGLNEIIAHSRASKYKGARIERENVEWCAWHIVRAMRAAHWRPMDTRDRACKVGILVTFVEVNERRDVSNIVGGGLKYVLDALSRPRGAKGGAAAIYDDSPKWIQWMRTGVDIDPESPGIAITVYRMEDRNEA